ncbi:MAG: hypothetical protein EPO26_18780 [Chloroflexota bacterium]|nr:MAG: hypothetical protein EPO26_18780 [Chloroflexota bacterium]
MSLIGPEQRENLTGMRDVWCWALSWFLKPPSSPDKRSKQAALIELIKCELRRVESVEALHDLYSQDSRWCLQLARNHFPRDWPSLGVHATTAAAYGLRFVELMTRRDLDARDVLPRWVGEWAIW